MSDEQGETIISLTLLARLLFYTVEDTAGFLCHQVTVLDHVLPSVPQNQQGHFHRAAPQPGSPQSLPPQGVSLS